MGEGIVIEEKGCKVGYCVVEGGECECSGYCVEDGKDW